MIGRFQTYQFDWGFMTIDTDNEPIPEGFIAGPFEVEDIEEVKIRAGADIAVEEETIVIQSPMTDEQAQQIIDEKLTIEQWRKDNPDAIAIGGGN